MIAFNTVIENASGSALRDVITGNEVANILRGMGARTRLWERRPMIALMATAATTRYPLMAEFSRAAGQTTCLGDGNDTVLAGGRDLWYSVAMLRMC